MRQRAHRGRGGFLKIRGGLVAFEWLVGSSPGGGPTGVRKGSNADLVHRTTTVFPDDLNINEEGVQTSTTFFGSWRTSVRPRGSHYHACIATAPLWIRSKWGRNPTGIEDESENLRRQKNGWKWKRVATRVNLTWWYQHTTRVMESMKLRNWIASVWLHGLRPFYQAAKWRETANVGCLFTCQTFFDQSDNHFIDNG